MSQQRLIVSSDTLIELGTVLSRTKFDRYLTLADRLAFFDRLRRTAIHVRNVSPIAVCRDPRDDKFLALALTGGATLILTGDNDLLTLHPFRTVAILSPRQYLNAVGQA